MHPILIEYHGMKLYSYGLMMVVGFLFAIWFINRYANRVGMTKSDAVDMTIIAFISGILGARFIFVLLNFKQYGHLSKLFEFQKGGLSWHGGMLGGLLAIFIYCLVKKYSFPAALDLVYTPAAASLGIGRIGCFLNGCCYGKACSLPWAVTFPYHKHPIPVHPTQIYEMILDFALFGFLVYWWNRRKFQGESVLMMLSIYSVIRFIVESFRYNTPSQMIHGLSLAQWFSIGFFIVGMALALFLRSRSPGLVGDIPMKTSPEEEKEQTEEETGEAEIPLKPT